MLARPENGARVPSPRPHSTQEVIKINVTCQRQKPGSNQVLTSPGRSGEPRTSDHTSALGSDIVAALRLLTKMIN